MRYVRITKNYERLIKSGDLWVMLMYTQYKSQFTKSSVHECRRSYARLCTRYMHHDIQIKWD